MKKLNRRSALALGLAGASAAMVKPAAAQTAAGIGWKDATPLPGRRRTYLRRLRNLFAHPRVQNRFDARRHYATGIEDCRSTDDESHGLPHPRRGNADRARR